MLLRSFSDLYFILLISDLGSLKVVDTDEEADLFLWAVRMSWVQLLVKFCHAFSVLVLSYEYLNLCQ